MHTCVIKSTELFYKGQKNEGCAIKFRLNPRLTLSFAAAWA